MLAGKQSAKVRLPQKAGANGAKLAAESKFGTILIPERQHSTAQHSTAQHSTAQHSTAQLLQCSTLACFLCQADKLEIRHDTRFGASHLKGSYDAAT